MGSFSLTAVAFALAAAPQGERAARGAEDRLGNGAFGLVQVSPTELIDPAKLNRVSRSAGGQGPRSVTFYFATDGERSNFALTDAEADAAWQMLTGRAGGNGAAGDK